MKIVTFCLFILSTTLLFWGCASTEALPPPQWVDNVRSVYPSDTYIAQVGEGKSAAEAKNNAVAAVATYLKTQVQTRREASLRMFEQNGSVTSERALSSKTVVTSDVDLSAVEYARPWQSAQRTWYCAAYIERESAWKNYEPVLRSKRAAFMDFYDKAQNEKEPLLRIRWYNAAQASGDEFTDAYLFALLLSDTRTENAYKNDFALVSSIKALREQALQKSTLFISVKDDTTALVEASVTKAISSCHFITEKKQSAASYTALVLVDYGLTDMRGIKVASPSVSLSIESSGTVLYTYTVTAPRTNGLDERIVKTQAAQALANALESKLADDICEKLGL